MAGRTTELQALVQQSLQHSERLPRLRTDSCLAILEYFNNSIPETEFVELSKKTKLEQCMGSISVGIRKLSQADRDGAKQFFRDALSTCVWTQNSYRWSRSFLARLEADASWPHWIEATKPNDPDESSPNI